MFGFSSTRKNLGKTTFAESLPGFFNCCAGVWNIEGFNPYADYTIYENVPWDDFETDGYPDKKQLLTQSGPLQTVNSHGAPVTIDINQPAIVLLNPDDDIGSLRNTPSTNDTDAAPDPFWSDHAYIYRMTDDDTFYDYPESDLSD